MKKLIFTLFFAGVFMSTGCNKEDPVVTFMIVTLQL
jgi:hypothetical protein